MRLPPIYSIDPKLILVDYLNYDVKIIVSADMFERKAKRPNLFTLEELRYFSPEELKNERIEITIPMWVIGCMMYEAHFKRSPFQTSLNNKVTLSLIKEYPPIYPRSMMVKHLPDLNDCVMQLLEKDHSQRLGSESFELEVLNHDFFTEESDV